MQLRVCRLSFSLNQSSTNYIEHVHTCISETEKAEAELITLS